MRHVRLSLFVVRHYEGCNLEGSRAKRPMIPSVPHGVRHEPHQLCDFCVTMVFHRGYMLPWHGAANSCLLARDVRRAGTRILAPARPAVPPAAIADMTGDKTTAFDLRLLASSVTKMRSTGFLDSRAHQSPSQGLVDRFCCRGARHGRRP